MNSCGNGGQTSFLNLINMKIVDFFGKCCFTGIVCLFISIPLFSQIKVEGAGNEAFRGVSEWAKLTFVLRDAEV
jgi:hypothetical protein